MELFLDTADLDEIKEALQYGCISGITTNPTIVSRTKTSFKKILASIIGLVTNQKIFVEPVSNKTEDIIEEALEIAKLSNNIVIKLPATYSALRAIRSLKKNKVEVLTTLIFSVNQAVMASCAGADYIAPFVGRVEQLGYDGTSLVREISQIFNHSKVSTKILAASIKSTRQVSELFLAGADIVTCPMSVLSQMMNHPLTISGLETFESDWAKVEKLE